MSADRQRLTSAIRRIAKTDPEIRGLLDAADNKGGKPGAAGVGGGTASEKGDNIVNETRICCDGSVGDPNPGVDERDPDSGGQTGLDPDDPADTDQGSGTLDGVADCATGQPICFDGSGFIPPDGWDSPTDPPIVHDFEAGFYWVADVEGTTYSSPSASMLFNSLPNQITKYFVNNPQYYYKDEYIYRSSDSITIIYIRDTGDTISYGGNRYSCGGSEYEADGDVCPDEAPVVEAWPSDGCTNLTVINGTIVGSKYDPENDGSFSAPRSSIDLCSGTDQISLAPSASGGWKTINSTTNNGYLYDSSGRQIAHIDGNEYSDPSV